MDSLKKAVRLIREKRNYSFAIMPEGTRSLDGRLGLFKSGGFHLALATGLDILPIVQIGAYRINRKGTKLIRPGRLRYLIEPPVTTAGYTKDNLRQLIDRVRSVFARRLDE